MKLKLDRTLRETLDEAHKIVLMWATWKLKISGPEHGMCHGSPMSVWDGLSKHDKDFNLVWNEIYGDCKDLSLPKLKKVMDFVRTL